MVLTMLQEKKKKAKLSSQNQWETPTTNKEKKKKKPNARRRVKDPETNLPVAPEEDTISISQSIFFSVNTLKKIV